MGRDSGERSTNADQNAPGCAGRAARDALADRWGNTAEMPSERLAQMVQRRAALTQAGRVPAASTAEAPVAAPVFLKGTNPPATTVLLLLLRPPRLRRGLFDEVSIHTPADEPLGLAALA